MNGLRLTLIGLLSILWWWQPLSSSAPPHIDYGNGSSGGNHEFRDSYLAIPRGPIWLSDVARIDSVARQHQAMAVVVEPETETQTGTTDHTGESDWAGEAARTGDYGSRPQLSSRGEATYYHPSLAGRLMRIGNRRYTPSDSSIAAVGVNVVGQPTVELGTALEICHEERCIIAKVQDTGYLGEKNIDLSEEAFKRLAPLRRGRIPISWRVVDFGS